MEQDWPSGLVDTECPVQPPLCNSVLSLLERGGGGQTKEREEKRFPVSALNAKAQSL